MTDPNAGLVTILRKTLPWIRLLYAFGYLTAGLLTLLCVASWAGIASDRVERLPLQALIIYPLLIVISLVPALYLHKSARRIQIFMAQGHTVQLESVLEAQRGLWRFLGLVALLMLVILLGVIVIGVLASL